MEEGNLLANDVRKFDEIGIEGINAALGEVFEKTAEGDEMIGLSDGLEIFSVAVDFTIELKTVFTQELRSDVGRFEVTGVVGFADPELRVLFEYV